MRNRKMHNNACIMEGIPLKICNETNGWMDAPSQKIPGPMHREKRHSKISCIFAGIIWGIDGYKACRTHLVADNIDV